MGITIHYDADLKKEKLNKAKINKIISFVEMTAKKIGYEYFVLKNEKGYVSKMRTIHADKRKKGKY